MPDVWVKTAILARRPGQNELRLAPEANGVLSHTTGRDEVRQDVRTGGISRQRLSAYSRQRLSAYSFQYTQPRKKEDGCGVRRVELGASTLPGAVQLPSDIALDVAHVLDR